MAELRIEATLDNLDQVIGFVDEQLETVGCPMKTEIQLNVAVEEIFVNIAHYAYSPDVGEALIQFEVAENPRAVIVTFTDNGIHFDPLAKPDPDVTLSAEERQIGGLGIYMVKKSMDEVTYFYRDQQNVLKLKKYL
ncbi:MAG: ATP-binding protein [Lachnospiraceae bacterium]|nr:ATP-binding protein [Lachnospiraceae bacterium]